MDEVFCSGLFGLFASLLLTPLLFCIVWYFSEVCQLISDLWTGDSPLARTERDRELEGRLFDPLHQPGAGEPLVGTQASQTGFPEFPFRHTFHIL
jgi:hypothetical protein